MLFRCVGLVFIFYWKKKIYKWLFFKLRLIGLGSFSVRNLYQNTFDMTTDWAPHLWEREIVSFVFLPLPFLHIVTKFKNRHPTFQHILPSVLQEPIFICSYSIPAANWGQDTINITCHLWFLVTTDQDGPKILCSKGNWFWKREKHSMMMERKTFQIVHISENSDSDFEKED